MITAPSLQLKMFSPAESGFVRASEYWYLARNTDPEAISLFWEHYSCPRRKQSHLTRGIAGPGEQIALISAEADALFLWLYQKKRDDNQTGVNCAVFRNEGGVLSSELIRQAVDVARLKWGSIRLFTYVDPNKTRRKRDPGRCFVKAGWKRLAQTSQQGLVILEHTIEST